MNKSVKVYKDLSESEWLKMRQTVVTSTGMSAILGLSSYTTRLEYYYEKAEGHTKDFEVTERIKWGNRLEAAIAEGLAEDNNWSIEPFKDFLIDENLGAGSSFDYKITEDPERPGQTGILEIKNVDSLQVKNKWIIEEGEVIEAPPYIEIQTMYQLLISGLDFIKIGALVGGNAPVLLTRVPDEDMFNYFRQEILEFNKLVQAKTPPEPNWEADAKFISSLYTNVQSGSVMDSEGMSVIENAVDEYHQVNEIYKQASARREAIKAFLITQIGDSEKVKNPHFTISAGYTEPKQMSFQRKGFRNFRINLKGKYKENK